MLGRRVMFTPNGFEVNVRVSRIAARSASGDGWVNAVSRPAIYGELKIGVWVSREVRTEATSFGYGCHKSWNADPKKVG